MYEYPFGNGQQLNLDWFLNEWKNLLAAWDAEKNGIEGALQAEIDRAEAALADVFSARDAAAQSAANALESKNAAAQSASDTSGYLATVRADANTASNAARNAAQSESNAAESAQTALASKNTAANSERNAAQSEANALTSKNAAAQSASDADASKSAAAQSAADADASKSAAAQSAEDAEDAANSVEASAQQITTNANDISNLKESINNIETATYAGFEQKTITDVPIASFDDGADDVLVKKLVVDIEPVQSGSGDPSPYNIRPITGWTGANVVRSGINIWDESWEVGSYRTDNGEKYTDNQRIRSADYISVKPNTTYYCKSNTQLKICFYDSDKTFILTLPSVKETSFTTPENAYFLALTNVPIDYGTTYENDWSINYPSSDFDYHSGKNNKTYDITFPSEAGTVYGGKLEINEVGSGVLTVTDAQIASYNGESLPSTWISDRDVYAPGTTPSIGAQVVYKLATTITYQLTTIEIKTLLGTNNICADTGDVDVTYRAMNNTSGMITLTKALIAPVLDRMVADTALSVNEFRIVGDTLYKVTVPIASGGTLTVGTNVTATTIGEQITALRA